MPACDHATALAAAGAAAVIGVLFLRNNNGKYACLLVVLVAMFILRVIATRRRPSAVTFRMHLFANDSINESLVLETQVAGRDALFVIDTGYAGPPVLSLSYLGFADSLASSSLQERYQKITEQLARGVSEDDQHRAVDAFLTSGRCRAYTSGCTMKLMGIGSVREQQSDMFLCPPLRMRTTDGKMAPRLSAVDADVFVTNPLPQSIHVLTCDYLMHASPCLLDVQRGQLHLGMSAVAAASVRARMTMFPFRQSGGAFVVTIRLGGEAFDVTVDTGAPGPVSLGADAAARLRRCSVEGAALRQLGVNGEDICSDIIRAPMEFCGQTVGDVPVFLNTSAVEGVDGYVGMGVLRAFNLFITESGIGFELNGLPLRSAASYARTTTEKSCGVPLRCDSQK